MNNEAELITRSTPGEKMENAAKVLSYSACNAFDKYCLVRWDVSDMTEEQRNLFMSKALVALALVEKEILYKS